MSTSPSNPAADSQASVTLSIKHRITGAVLFTTELPEDIASQSAAKQLGYAVKAALEARATTDFQREALARISDVIEVSESGCWLLNYGLVGGYPRICIGGQRQRVHKLVWEIVHGAAPPRLLLRHTCDVRACVNPSHIVPGTHQDNMDDMVARNRTTRGRPLSDEHRRKVALSLLGKRRAMEDIRRCAEEAQP